LKVAGIVLETENYWNPVYARELGCFIKVAIADWMIRPYKLCDDSIPAPMWTEVWRELPEEIQCHSNSPVTCSLSMWKEDEEHVCGYYWHDYIQHITRSKNPTDALIDLLIWLKGEKNESRTA
jgi:hypothetical protein